MTRTETKELIIGMAKVNCRIEHFGFAAFHGGLMTIDQGNAFFDQVNRLTKRQEKPFSEISFEYLPSLN